MSRGARHDLFIIDSADQMAMVTEVQGYRRGARLRKFASGSLVRFPAAGEARGQYSVSRSLVVSEANPQADIGWSRHVPAIRTDVAGFDGHK